MDDKSAEAHPSKTKKRVIGLTGHYATGKSTISNAFKESGYSIIEVDHLGHQALIDKQDEIIKVFGEKILNDERKIDRKKLGKIVFQGEKELKKLERIVHPHMVQLVKNVIKKEDSHHFLISAAILIEMELHHICDKIILLTAPIDKIIQWGKERDSLSENEIKLRLKNQLPVKNREVYADVIIENNGSLTELKKRVRTIINSLDEEIL